MVNQERTIIESISNLINLKTKFHARRRLGLPKELLCNNPPAPTRLGLPKELSSVFNFPILIFFVGQAKKKNYVAN